MRNPNLHFDRKSIHHLASVAWHSFRRHHTLRRLITEWRTMSAGVTPREFSCAPIKRVVIIPSDPATLIGAKGDEAMMEAAIDALSTRDYALDVGVLTGTRQASESARALGFTPFEVWNRPWSLTSVDAAVNDFHPDAVLLVGADVLDGSYSPLDAIRMLIVADLAVRRGVQGHILGFSLSRRVHRYVPQVFDALDPRLSINVRDEISLERFKKHSKANARLVSDIAFLLKPDLSSQRVQAIRLWIEGQTTRGNVVLGFNIHPMLIDIRAGRGVHALISGATEALRQLLRAKPLSIVLLSHDYRGEKGDDTCLKPIYEAMAEEFGERMLYPAGPLRAAEIKGAVGYLQGVLTGRMHLAIASLGMGVPVAALTYQDKFEGLFRHFDLPRWLLFDPAEGSDATRLASFIDAFLRNLPELRDRVTANVNRIETAAAQNLHGPVADSPSRSPCP